MGLVSIRNVHVKLTSDSITENNDKMKNTIKVINLFDNLQKVAIDQRPLERTLLDHFKNEIIDFMKKVLKSCSKVQVVVAKYLESTDSMTFKRTNEENMIDVEIKH